MTDPTTAWTRQQVELLVKHHDGTTESRRSIAYALGMTIQQVTDKVQELEAAPRHRRRSWTEEERRLLQERWDDTADTRRQLAIEMDRSELSIRGMARNLGLNRTNRGPNWTPVEDATLRHLVQRHNLDEVAEIMKRTPTAVRVRSKRIHASPRIRHRWYAMREVTAILGVDHKVVRQWITDGHIDAKRHYPHRQNTHPHKNTWHISQQALREFIIRHCHTLCPRLMDLPTVIRLLADNGSQT